MNSHHSLNPNSLKSRFTKGFLRSLIKINRERVNRNRVNSCCGNNNNPAEIFKRCYEVKSAADKSLAFAVGRRRAWSRAMLCKIRNRACKRKIINNIPRRVRIRVKRIKNSSEKKAKIVSDNNNNQGFDQACKLRKLVPGGEGMDLCSLLDEAAHYIKCLNTQVQVMRSIADNLCSSSTA